jgi:hypothetical protein
VVDGFEFGGGKLRARLDGTRLRINEFTLYGWAAQRRRSECAGDIADQRPAAGTAAQHKTHPPARQHPH